MKIKTDLRRYIITATLAVLAAVIIVVAAGRGRVPIKPITNRQQEEQRAVSTMPSVISSVKEVEVVSAFIDDEKQANIVVMHNSSKAIQGLAISSGSFSLIEDNGLTTDQPGTLIAPHAKYTIQLPASNLRANLPVTISGALYDDSTEDGDNAVRAKMHQARQNQREKRLVTEPKN